jgi:hypothetical protein
MVSDMVLSVCCVLKERFSTLDSNGMLIVHASTGNSVSEVSNCRAFTVKDEMDAVVDHRCI